MYKKQEVIEILKRYDDDKLFYLEEYKEKKGQRTKMQNRVFYRCFWLIAKKMWLSENTVKQNCLKALFWVEKTVFGWVEYENAIQPKTSGLNKEQWILLIESLIEFWKKLDIKNMVMSRELQNLFYNKE